MVQLSHLRLEGGDLKELEREGGREKRWEGGREGGRECGREGGREEVNECPYPFLSRSSPVFGTVLLSVQSVSP